MTAPAKVEQRHRVDYTVSDSHEASALLSALRNMHCDRPHSIFGPPCERCLSTVHDALAKAICVIRTDAEQRGREAERERIENALGIGGVLRYDEHIITGTMRRAENGDWFWVDDVFAAIRGPQERSDEDHSRARGQRKEGE